MAKLDFGKAPPGPFKSVLITTTPATGLRTGTDLLPAGFIPKLKQKWLHAGRFSVLCVWLTTNLTHELKYWPVIWSGKTLVCRTWKYLALWISLSRISAVSLHFYVFFFLFNQIHVFCIFALILPHWHVRPLKVSTVQFIIIRRAFCCPIIVSMQVIKQLWGIYIFVVTGSALWPKWRLIFVL